MQLSRSIYNFPQIPEDSLQLPKKQKKGKRNMECLFPVTVPAQSDSITLSKLFLLSSLFVNENNTDSDF